MVEIIIAVITKADVPITDLFFSPRNLFFPNFLPTIAAITSDINRTDKLITAIIWGKKNIVTTAAIITHDAPLRCNSLCLISCFRSIKPNTLRY